MKYSKAIKEQILYNIITPLFHKKFEALTVKKSQFADRIFKKVITSDIAELIADLPSAFKSKEQRINAHFGEAYAYLRLNGNVQLDYCTIKENPLMQKTMTTRWELSAKSELRPKHWDYVGLRSDGNLFVFKANSVESRAFRALVAEEDKLVAKYVDMIQEVWVTLNAVKTAAALLKAWPDVDQYFPPEELPQTLPALNVGPLRRKITNLKKD